MKKGNGNVINLFYNQVSWLGQAYYNNKSENYRGNLQLVTNDFNFLQI